MAYNSSQTARGLMRLISKQQLTLHVGRTIASPPLSITRRRSVHVSVYDKNLEEHVQEHVSQRSEADQDSSSHYWAPHPKTGVFGPSSEGGNTDIDDSDASSSSSSYVNPTSSAATVAEDSTLEQKTFFRPLEDMEKQKPTSI